MVRNGRRLLLPPPPPPPPPAKMTVPYYPFYPLPDRYIEALQEELSKEVDLCQMEFAEMLPLGTWFPQDIPRLFIQHQIHFVYASRFLEACGTNSHAEYLVSVMKAQEVVYLQKYHGVVTFSDQDRQVLLPYVPPDRLFTSPFPIPTDPGITRVLPPAFDGRFLFLGSAEHGPNRDALEWLITKIWPEIVRQMPSARLVVVGDWKEKSRIGFTDPSVTFLGYVRDLASTLRGAIMLVPLRIGSGIRVKIMVAMGQGVPVVSTSVGCEGLQVSDGEELLVRDGESEFAAAAIRLARDHDLWHKMSSAGLSSLIQHYSPANVRRRRNEIYAALTKSERLLHTHAK
jgi:glycosyltransferase involved in cell wall biosynthesis